MIYNYLNSTGSSHINYLSKTICDEIMLILAEQVNSTIIN